MGDEGKASHSAEASALGFWYQSLYALLILAEMTTDDAAIAVERLDDIELAAGQYIDLVSGGYFKVRLFGSMEDAPSDEEIHRTIQGAVRVFMAAYGCHNKPVIDNGADSA